MGQRSLLLFFILLILGSFTGTVFCDEEAGVLNPRTLLSRADEEIFTRSRFIQDFSEDQGYVNEFPDPATIHQYFIYDGVGTDRLISLLPAAENVRTSNKRLNFNHIRQDEFHVTYSLQQSEDIPESGNGLCWIRYSDIGIIPEGKNSGIILFPGDKAYFFSPSEEGPVYEPIADLSELDPHQKLLFDFIRLDHTIYVYINGEFFFSYKDGLTEWVSFESGAELFRGANQIRCDFDDFTMRVN